MTSTVDDECVMRSEDLYQNSQHHGVLLRSAKPLPRAQHALKYLQRHRIPFILLTNGGGKHERERVDELSQRLDVPLDVSQFVQSHTPFQELVNEGGKGNELRDKCVLVSGGDGDRCRNVAESYGFRNVITPGDIFHAYPEIWPFSSNFASYYAGHARPLPFPPYISASTDGRLDQKALSKSLKVDAVFVFNDPRDWALDLQIILDLLLSHRGYLGTLSPLNGDSSLPNCGYQQNGQPPLYFANPDLWWAAAYHLNRLGQGGFREALEGVWAAVTGGKEKGVELKKIMYGKPYTVTYGFAEGILQSFREEMLEEKNVGKGGSNTLKNVYMVGDNPESDIRGANEYRSSQGTKWHSVLVKSGVYNGGEPAWKPTATVGDVWDAVQLGLIRSGWLEPMEGEQSDR
ncbi:hypothetical protein MMC25_003211 [Agyrium rufum]|nr:hypothetical protein [Agyrium rufum]